MTSRAKLQSSHRDRRKPLSARRLVACALAVVGSVLVVVGVVTPAAGLVLVPSLYAVGVLATPNTRKEREREAPRREVTAVRRTLRGVRVRSMRRVPPAVSIKIARISNVIAKALPRADVLGVGSRDRFLLVQAATDYLPGAVDAYLSVSPADVRRPVLPDGRTPLELLNSQVDLIGERVDRIAAKIDKLALDGLVVHSRYLDDALGDGMREG